MLQKFAQVAATLRECADIADQFAAFANDVAPSNGRKRKGHASDEDMEDEGDGKKKKRKTTKKIKDPNAPKRPPSSYILFQNEIRKELKAKYPDLPPPELVQMISKKWAAMTDVEKAVCAPTPLGRVLSLLYPHSPTMSSPPLQRLHGSTKREHTTPNTAPPSLPAKPLSLLPHRYVSTPPPNPSPSP